MKLFEKATCANLPPVEDALKQEILQAERTYQAHDSAVQEGGCLA